MTPQIQMMHKYFDTHCHLAGSELKDKALLLAENAIKQNVMGMALISADIANLLEVPEVARQLKQRWPELHIVFTSGLHPHEADKATPEFLSALRETALSAAAIGETGLDYFYEFSDREKQKELFQWHIDLAVELKKPLVIHCRNAAEDMMKFLAQDSLKKHPCPGIFHCFTEDQKTANQAIDLGFYISVSGIVTFKNATALKDIVKSIPLDKLLIETDSPWLAPLPHRGKTNEPAFVKYVFDYICTLRTESPDTIAENLWKNSCKVFGLAV